ncbi:MBL fold metallo-hydrolase [Corallococcus sp. ZKHCc1 1396]|uniref:MBL fold metallo-hydrolase n=1 Tax=Corallococcus soli TaxID=2710757 RepID=A0ABR9PWP5_9BACT|nr:MBL fold metallo-hydrolase [Corallococcus soli]MBE4752351.1 MBL fold metallo-hydrolase [Corallococcus soli]
MPADQFVVEMLPADNGDCLLLTYGCSLTPQRVIIDGGTAATFPRLRRRIEELPLNQRHFELLIVTHIDSDHIDGVLPLLRAKELGVTFGDIWFNGWSHLIPPKSEFLGPRKGDILGNHLSMRTELPWNSMFNGKAVVVSDGAELPTHTLPGGMKLTLLSPTWRELAKLDAAWIEESFQQGRIPGERPAVLGSAISQLQNFPRSSFIHDHSAANGSSIAVLAEYQGKRCLFGADAFAGTLRASLQRIPGVSGRVVLDAFKLPHHASQANVSVELIQAVQCSRYLVSTNGSLFGHPDDEALARIFQSGQEVVELFFNYDSQTTGKWRSFQPALETGVRKYQAHYPTSPDGGLRIEL